MDGRIDLLSILALVVAIALLIKLRSVLGRRSGEEDKAQRKRAAEREARLKSAMGEKVVVLPTRSESSRPGNPGEAGVAAAQDRIRVLASGNASLERGLNDVLMADKSFDPEHFISGARRAYEFIVTAFAEGNRKTLKDLLSREVYEGFVEAIQGRESRGEQIDQSFVGISKADVIEADVKGGRTIVTVKFVSQLISATRDQSGAVISGDPQKIKEVTDVWTFARDISSRNPNWHLIATQSAN